MAMAKAPPYHFFTLATNVWTAPYWAAAARGELVAASCEACGHARMPPTPFCPRCHHQGIHWVRLSGLATVYSYTVVERAIIPGMEEHLPYVPAVVEPDDLPGVRLVSNLVGMELTELRVGLPVRLTWHHTAQGIGLTQFRLR
ncbi:MAG: putative small subunit of thiolase DitF [Pseudomonadota bacterium]|jgi:uncharacterized OB-fold protein